MKKIPDPEKPNQLLQSSVLDPHWLYEDPDPAF
jgi:hypothetical protein